MDKTLNTVEDSIFGDGKTAKETTEKATVNSKKTIKDKTLESVNSEVDNKIATVDQSKPELSWSRFDFVPGTEIIFEDDFSGEKNGEFPSRWRYDQGQY